MPICVATLCLRAASVMARASQMLCVSGFWQKACFPRMIAPMVAGKWLWSGVLTVTASSLSPSSS